MQDDMYKHEMSPYLQPKHADRHVAGRVSRRMDSSHAASYLDVGVSLSMLLSHAERHVCARVSPHMQPKACRLTHSRLCGSILLVDDFYKYPYLPSVSDIHSTPKAKSSVQISPSKLLSILYDEEEVLSRQRSVPRVQISQSSEVRYSAGRFEELSISGRRFCSSPDQSIEAFFSDQPAESRLEHCHCFLKLVPLSRSWSGKWLARFSLVDHQGRVSHVDVTAPGESDRGPGHGDSDSGP
ncbi:hypothetical protein DY000_02047956 [Brassica cretica]|uniref:Uncharacterized protein n=1 Tax=Brassica cretica TaxID=69181 RepID=A0ABQ7EZI2_BRACR|nr:hypothetical protein DY000_02047956 [Brassica cretica]